MLLVLSFALLLPPPKKKSLRRGPPPRPLSKAAAMAKRGAPKKIKSFLGKGTESVVASTIGDHASLAA
jgi:hypothetical protein